MSSIWAGTVTKDTTYFISLNLSKKSYEQAQRGKNGIACVLSLEQN
jgi:hypothetical protein